ncbi:MAG: exodeoxyribonuclease V subunit alpha, partial [Mycobacterium sp.]|nr:exodeoxyribonuclease V subunit alpha [Mycobacterium sp.]
MTVDEVDVANWRRAQQATGRLRAFNDAGVLESADVLVAQRLTTLAGESDEAVALAVAFVSRAVRAGSVCVDITCLQDQIDMPELDWPAPQAWLEAVSTSPLLGAPPVLHLDEGLLYFDRYWLEECQVARDVRALAAAPRAGGLPDIARLF